MRMIVALVLVLLAGVAQGAQNLPLICSQPGVTGAAVCDKANRTYQAPTATTMVNVEPGGWVPFSAATTGILVCRAELALGSGSDSCAVDDKVRVAKCEVYGANCASDDEYSVTLAGSDVHIKWKVLGVGGCVASGGWTGDRPAIGEATINNVTSSATYTLRCERPGAVTLTWTAPTKNVDGSALTDLRGHTIVHGSSESALTELIKVDSPSITTYRVEGLPAGNRFFAVRAFNAKGTESANSNVLSKLISTEPKVFTRAVTVAETVPEAPAGLAVKDDTTAYELQKTTDKLALRRVGSVATGTQCDEAQSALGLFVVPRSKLILDDPSKPRPLVVLARCG